jgi:hypothetical protein
MARNSMDLTSFVGKLLKEDDSDILQDGIKALAQMIMDGEVSSRIGAAPYERTETRTAYRNGYRTRAWDTRVGTVELKVPKITAGTYFPSLLDPRRRAEKALQAVIVEAYVKGVSTRKVDTSSGLSASTGSPSPRSAAPARAWMRTSRRSCLARSRTATPTCGSTPPSTRSESSAGWSRSPP